MRGRIWGCEGGTNRSRPTRGCELALDPKDLAFLLIAARPCDAADATQRPRLVDVRTSGSELRRTSSEVELLITRRALPSHLYCKGIWNSTGTTTVEELDAAEIRQWLAAATASRAPRHPQERLYGIVVAKPSHSPDGRRTGRFTANGWIIKEGKRKERKAKEIPFMAEGREAVTRENLSGMALEGAESPRSGFHPLFLLFLSENTVRRIFWAGWALPTAARDSGEVGLSFFFCVLDQGRIFEAFSWQKRQTLVLRRGERHRISVGRFPLGNACRLDSFWREW
jgi:hypothetical protein